MKVLKYWRLIIVYLLIFTVLILTYHKGAYDKNQQWVIRDLARIGQETKNALLMSEAARQQEQKYIRDLTNIDKSALDKIRNIQNETSNTIAALKRDNVRLSISIKNNHAKACSEGSGISMDHGETRAELSDEAFEFLAGEAERADRVAVQLRACQKIIDIY